MPPKKRAAKEPLTEGSSQVGEEQVPTTAQTTTQVTHIPQTLHSQPSTSLHKTTTDPTEKPITQTEVPALNTSDLNTMPLPSHQHQTIGTQEDLQQDSEEEIEAIIEDELAYLHQENERMRFMQEQSVRRKAMAKRSQVIQQQIEQKKTTQVELQQVIEDLYRQEHEPSMQEHPQQQEQPQRPLYQGIP
jgi:hypothetical protein